MCLYGDIQGRQYQLTLELLGATEEEVDDMRMTLEEVRVLIHTMYAYIHVTNLLKSHTTLEEVRDSVYEYVYMYVVYLYI